MKMDCANVETVVIDYLDNQLSDQTRKAFELHLSDCAACQQQMSEFSQLFNSISKESNVLPSPLLRENFNTMLQSEINILATENIIEPVRQQHHSLISIRGTLMKIAACLLLIAGGAITGSIITKKSLTGVAPGQIAELQTEVKQMKEAVMLNLLNDESASERIKAVTFVDQMNSPGNEVIQALIKTMNGDENVNVRLAALNTVSKFASSAPVRDSLVNSLANQKEPIVQIVLINILIDKKETKAIKAIKNILSDKSTLAPVKDAAAKGLRLL